MKNKLQIIGVILFLLMIVFAICYTNNPKVSGIKKTINNDFSDINHPTGSKLVSCDMSNKSNEAKLYANFTTSNEIDEIRKFYVKELAKRGWAIDEGKELANVNGDLNFLYLTYYKDDLRLSIQDTGAHSYSILISWGGNYFNKTRLVRIMFILFFYFKVIYDKISYYFTFVFNFEFVTWGK